MVAPLLTHDPIRGGITPWGQQNPVIASDSNELGLLTDERGSQSESAWREQEEEDTERLMAIASWSPEV
jgi:hypothetical protein